MNSLGYSLRASWGMFNNPYGQIVRGNYDQPGPFINAGLSRSVRMRPTQISARRNRRHSITL